MRTFLIILFTLLTSFTYAQKLSLNFSIDSISNGTKIYLKSYLNKEYYSTEIIDSTIVKNNEIQFLVNEISFSSPFILETEIVNRSYDVSRPFYLKKKSLNIKLNDIYGRIDNDITERNYYEKYFKNIDEEIINYENFRGQNYIKYQFNTPKEINDSLDSWYKINWTKEINLLEQYIKDNPKSELALWKVIEKFERNKNYSFEYLLSNFDSNIQNSYPFKVLDQKIKENKIFGINKIFPKIDNLKTLEREDYQSDYTKNKYTLIDFWFSYCGPCILEIPHHKKIFNEFKDNGFDIISISTDRSKDIQNWLNIISKHDMNWTNLIDENGVESKKMNINKFPTNFLLDKDGNIIKKDISSDDLYTFLNGVISED